MKFYLTLYLCSLIQGNCVVPMQQPYMYPKIYNTHYECVRAGLSDSYEILYAEKFFDKDRINEFKLYPNFMCEEVKQEGA